MGFGGIHSYVVDSQWLKYWDNPLVDRPASRGSSETWADGKSGARKVEGASECGSVGGSDQGVRRFWDFPNVLPVSCCSSRTPMLLAPYPIPLVISPLIS